MNYRIVEQIGSEWRITETDDITKNERGLSWRTNFNPRHRQELQGQPIFNGYAGPSWMVKQSDTRIRKRIMF